MKFEQDKAVLYVYTTTKHLTFDTLLSDIRHEIEDDGFTGRSHGRNDVYRDGCRGPLCKYRERTRKREARTKAALLCLPAGVQPSTRPRDEQKWDTLLAAAILQLDGSRERQTSQEMLINRLNVDLLRRYLELLKDQKVEPDPVILLELQRIPQQISREYVPKSCAVADGAILIRRSS